MRFRSWHRGTRGSDRLLGEVGDRHLAGFGEDEIAQYERLLERSDPDIYNWYTGREAPPDELDGTVLRLLLDFKREPVSK